MIDLQAFLGIVHTWQDIWKITNMCQISLFKLIFGKDTRNDIAETTHWWTHCRVTQKPMYILQYSNYFFLVCSLEGSKGDDIINNIILIVD